ncbi:MAG: tyrosine-type recombinase/integrase [Mycobacterium sp.]|nr:tyrosine-type recombinase/integrase [Mycobacterium sp.]
MTATTRATRARIARRQADQLGLRMVQRGNVFTLHSRSEGTVFTGSLRALEKYLAEVYQPAPCGPDRAVIPSAWRQPVRDYCTHLAGIGRAPTTVRAHRLAVGRIGRELRCGPQELTAARLIAWFAAQDWKPETRGHYVSAVRSFVTWAYREGILAEHLADDLPSVRIPASTPRPVPDLAWTWAMAGADARTALMLRLAGEAGLRRAEVARVHVRDVVDGPGGAQLVVHGKGGKVRVVPLTDDLAEVLRQGAAGHTPEAAAFGPPGYLFPGDDNGHLTAAHVGRLVAEALPPGWSMHKLRHRFATRAFRGSGNLLAVRALLGHSSVATTQRYTAVDDDEIRSAAMAATFTPPGVCTPNCDPE